MATWTFTTPHLDEGPASWEDWLFVRVKLGRGVTILENPPGTFTAVEFPTQDDITNSSPRFYMGGHQYVVSDQDRTDLINANITINGMVVVDASNFVQIS